MAEAEDVIVDAARHTTVFLRDLWRRRHEAAPDALIDLASVAPQLDLLLTAAFGRSLPLRVALPPARPTLLHRLVRRRAYPRHVQAVPATDDGAIWLPANLGMADRGAALDLYRAMAMQQARRAGRGTASRLAAEPDPWLRDIALVLEARAAEREVAREFPGLAAALERLRRLALEARPPLSAFPPVRRPLEALVRRNLASEPLRPRAPCSDSVSVSLEMARRLLPGWGLDEKSARSVGPAPLFRDWWTGEIRAAPSGTSQMQAVALDSQEVDEPVRSARMSRRPEERDAAQGEDESGEPSVWAVQQDAPNESAEDPFGLQRPVDRDDETSADEYGDMLSEVASARMIAAPDPPREVLLSDDPPPLRSRVEVKVAAEGEARFRYPEWDYAANDYGESGTAVRILQPRQGCQSWVDAVLHKHQAQLNGVRRQFEALRPERIRLRRQADGEDIDLDACVEGRADLRAGGFLREGLYETLRPGRRSIAVCLLVDASGSTDAWIGGERRVIDVEREALLLVCAALQGLGEPFCITSFSGEGAQGVTMRVLKDFDEAYGNRVALRIAALEPERYTRAGAAIRHATSMLSRQHAEHRLLLLLSDGKPNDADRYDGRYGVEDMRQSVNEAKLQGIFPFCLTIDRQAPTYLPQVFGATNYGLLSSPERLPDVLLDWTRRLLAR
jgi:nitric oxide reductase NorD protein